MSDALVSDTLERLRLVLADRYAVERELGRGGMATVFLAQDLRHDRKVAIKVLRPELSASLGADRFLREIKLAARLQHPNILGLFDSGAAEGLLFYVMPFVEGGESLRSKLDREKQLAIDESIRLVREAADALGYAHGRGIVHRDIKPENILLSGGHVLVADFGIARAVDEAGGQKLTETGMAVGTPYYMSPEQAMGGEVDARSDIYSLGCVLYELLAGQPPFTGPTAMAILARHSLEAVPSVQVVRQSIPDEVEAIIMQALAKVPADRFKTMQEFSDALRDADYSRITQRTIPRILPTGTRTAQMPMVTTARRRWAYLVAGVVLAGAGVGAFMWLRGNGAAARKALTTGAGFDANRIAVLYFKDLSGKDSLQPIAAGLTEGLIRELGQVPTLEVISRNGVAPFRGHDVPAESIAKVLRVGTLVRGEVEPSGNRLRVTVRLIDGVSGAEIHRTSFDQPAANFLVIRDSISEAVAASLRELLGKEVRLREQREGTGNLMAWTLVQRAQQAAARGDSLAAANDTSGAADQSFNQADTLLAQAQQLDPSWVEPVLGRARLAYQRSRAVGVNSIKAAPWIERGLKLVNSAAQLAPNNADVLEVRGNLQYWRWLLRLEPDPVAAKQLLESARSDLETAVRISPSQAGAWASLSHLYFQTAGETDAKLAARRAYEADAYLANADVILNRLFFASYDLAQLVDAHHWCEEGQRRFPASPDFVECRLWMMTTKAAEPDVTKAWQLRDSLLARVPPKDRPYRQLFSQMIVAAVIARAGPADSARHVAAKARGNGETDPAGELSGVEAFVYTLLHDNAAAVRALSVYLAAQPDRRKGLAEDPGWWYRDLQSDPQFRALVGKP
ncbi:MAG TPA: serine/threonine-protein kinase [Gemmatimonadales bacterium]